METKEKIKEVKKFIDLIKNTDVVELHWEKDGVKIGFRRSEIPLPESGPVEDNRPNLSKGPAEEKKAGSLSSESSLSSRGLVKIKSPMVGTFWLIPSSGTIPYVEKGLVIKKGDKIGVIEAMKIMKEIESHIEGKVVDILVENGQPVEFGQELFLIDPEYKNP